MTDPNRLATIGRDLWLCQRTGQPVNLDWDSCHHRQLKGQGGSDLPANRVMLSGSGTTGAHGWAHHNRTEAQRLGYIVPSWADPAGWPMYSVPLRSWVLLSDDGTYRPIDPPPGDDAANWRGELPT
jgi:hypothetical protein